jgi:hypothetical protein
LAVNTADARVYTKNEAGTVQEVTRQAASSSIGRIQLAASSGALTDSSALTFDSSASTLTAGSLQVTNDATNTTIARTGNAARQLNLTQSSGGKVVIGDALYERDGIQLVVDESNLKVSCEGIEFTATSGLRAPVVSLWDGDQSNYVFIQAPAVVSANVTLTLPSTAGSNGQVLTTNGTGTLSWTTPSGGSVPDFLLFGAGII